MGPLLPRRSYPDCIIATRGYDFREDRCPLEHARRLSLAEGEASLAPASINGVRITYYSSIKVKAPALPNTSSTEE